MEQIQDLEPLVVICGPTASGKGSLARQLAKRIGGEIISADSRKVFRGLDVGTAKPTKEIRLSLPHHLLNVVEPGEHFDASMFVDLADEIIKDIRSRGKIPVLVGGTGLYIRSLIWGIIRTPPADPELRKRLVEMERADPGRLHKMLRVDDPQSAARIAPADVRRLVRALEVLELTGEPISQLQQGHGLRRPRYRSLVLGIRRPLEELYARIDERVLKMMAAGWLEETMTLMASLPESALDIVGYRQLIRYLRQECSLSEAVVDIQRAHRRYARQQLKWFRADSDIQWLDAPVDLTELERKVRAFLEG